ncbi:MAG TPA: PLD nuclease N-terminal domain-containing protein [Clostridiaceae bacterium]
MFGDMSNLKIVMMFLPLILLQVGLMVFCLFRLRKDNVRYLPKWGWALIIILGELMGPIIYLLIGRERD